MLGKTILHYKILEKLGEGGMGVVYKAYDTKLERTIAIKFLPQHISANSEERERFKIEAKAAAALNHPNIATIHAIEETDDEMFIVMEFIDGKELKEKISLGKVDIEESIRIATQIAEGLDAAHNKEVVHRDIKSSNIMITNDGKVKIMDFGLAKIKGGSEVTKIGSTIGTVAYMSPEQAKGEVVDVKTDIWSLGVVLFEMLTGELPFTGDYDQSIIYSILNDKPHALEQMRDDVPDKLAYIINKCLKKDSSERYVQSEEILQDLNIITVNVVSNTIRKKSNTKFSTRWKFALGGVLLVIMILIAYWWLFQSEQQNRPSSIAVLPFNNLNADASLDYFSDGMTETIISDLANISGLAVISRTSVMAYKNSGKNTREIGQDLNVTHILEGSVLTSEDKVRIFAQLIDVETDAHLWAQTYDREMKDIFSIQSDVAKKIAEILEVALGKDAQARIEEQPTSDLEAYRLYLQGQYYINMASFADIDTAISLFNRAILRDPNFAVAYAVLARTYILNNVDRDLSPEWEEKAYIAFQQALSLNPNLAEAYVARGMWYWTPSNNFEHENAIRDFEKAIELKPGLSSAYELLMLVQLHVGLLDKAMETGWKGVELEPTSMWARHFVGQVYFFQGNYVEALNMFKSVGDQLVPFFRIALEALTLYYLGRIEEATEMIEQGLLEYPTESQLNSSYAIILASLGRTDEARQRMDIAIENERALRHVHHLYHNLAGASALMGLNEEAVKWLKMAAKNGLPCYPLFNQDSNLKSLEGNPDFEAFMLELKNKLEYYETL
ncbi:MAG: protein kinase [Candidatus Dadabacteria bacterium]|nr:protein kinase [Candidatus Dadabacteria bacterium]